MPSQTLESGMTDRSRPTPSLRLTPFERPQRRGVLRRLRGDYALLLGLGVLGFVLFGALAGFFIPSMDPIAIRVDARFSPPSASHMMGTDQLGRDILARVAHGTRTSALVALGSVTLAALAGVTVGVASGYYGGVLDEVLMRAMDLLLAFPAILLALTIVAVLGQSTANLVLALGVVYSPRFARVARASALSVSTETYVEAALSLGASQWRILRYHVLPNILAPLLVMSSITLASAVLAEAGLSYLGLGVQPPYPSWGRMLSEGRAYMELAPWLAIFPGLSVALTVLSFNLVGDGLRDALDPRIKV